MTEPQENPYNPVTDSPESLHARPVKYILQGRSALGKPFTAQMEVPKDDLARMQDRIDRLNEQAKFVKFRIVSR